ncbi:Homeodomain-containing protein [Acanthamoeba polyphaga moumouvirus]|uniref:Homeodomain-containing protein n=1 Tax=Acanthamoeba polyphaga moumouvirus TaxID=1269028 RepID=L7RBX5_9VIRU|nr:Homeodomain-containing protein [Acanthamoeba polyphaga moumouvirus]AGC01666.1 Homeodomain-containing protein [Acanthamoeba polyphaga moumouvirus]AQN68002.1 homeodomain protein [Saudi moumouvirus]
MEKVIIIYHEHLNSFEESAVKILSGWKSERKNGIRFKMDGKKKCRLFTTCQLLILEEFYKANKYISMDKSIQLARTFGVTRKQINTWFQNKRAHDKRFESMNKN